MYLTTFQLTLDLKKFHCYLPSTSPLLSNNELFFSHLNFILQRGAVVVVVVVVVVVEVEVFVVVCVTEVEVEFFCGVCVTVVEVADVAVEISLAIRTVKAGVVSVIVVVDATKLALFDAVKVLVTSGVALVEALNT
jgi:hypothetical protein